MKTRAMKGRMTYPLMAAVCLVVSLVIGWSPYGQRINHIFYDLYFRQRGPQPPNENIVIVAIDDATLAEYGPLPLDRFKLAEGLRTIEDAHPGLIALDILLTDPKPGGGDLALRRAIGSEPPGGLLSEPTGQPASAALPELPGLAAMSAQTSAMSRTPVVLATALESGGGHWLNPRPEFALSAAAVGHVHADPERHRRCGQRGGFRYHQRHPDIGKRGGQDSD